MQEDELPEQPDFDEAVRYYDGLMTPAEAARFRARAGTSETFTQRALEVREVLEELAQLQVEPEPNVVAETTEQQRALWWKHRLRVAVGQLSALGQNYARFAEAGLEAAIELSLDAVRNTSRLLPGPASLCLRPDAGFDFALATVSSATKAKVSDSAKEPSEDMTTSIGTFVTSRIPGARVTVNEKAGSVMVEFLEEAVPETIVLIPENPAAEPVVMRTDMNLRAFTSGLQPGAYLLAVESQP